MAAESPGRPGTGLVLTVLAASQFLIYGVGSLTTALAPNLGVLLIGWSLIEGLGASLIMPAIVALVAANLPPERRAGAYGLVAAAGAMAVAAGPLFGGAVTTFASWRYVFAGELLMVLVILVFLRKMADFPASPARLDLVGSLLSQYLVQAGVFFAVPLFLSVVLELDALQAGLRILPLSIALLLAAGGIPKVWPRANPQRVVRTGLFLVLAGILVLVGGMDPGANAAVVAVPMLLIGSVLLATLTASVLAGIQDNPDVPTAIKEQASTQLVGGVPFISDSRLGDALQQAGVDAQAAASIAEVNAGPRLAALRDAFGLTAVLAAAALFCTGRIPRRAPGSPDPTGEPADQPDTIPERA